MGLKKRQKALIAELVKQRGFFTISDYASKFQVSERTISSDLKSIETYLESIGFKLVRYSGVGIEVQRIEAMTIDEDIFDLHGVNDSDYRVREILNRMLFKNEIVTFDKLSEELMISKTSIRSDLEKIRNEYIDNYTMQLISGSGGTYLVGNEDRTQRTFAKFNLVQLKKLNGSISNDILKNRFLSNHYGEELVMICNEALSELTFSNIHIIDDFYLFNVLNTLIVLTYRVKQGHHHKESINMGCSKEAMKLARKLLEKINLLLGLVFKKEELLYLAQHIEANKLITTTEENYYKNVSMLVSSVSELLRIDLSNDEILKNQLEKHFGPMVFRLRSNIYNQNPFTDQFRKEYLVLFNIITLAVHDLEDSLNIVFNSDEIGYLVIYFQLAIERVKEVKKVLVVCPLGISASHLLVNSIQSLLPPMDVIKVASLKQLEQIDLNNIDFAISTINLDIKTLPTVVVSAILSSEDKKNIVKFYADNLEIDSHKKYIEDVNLQEWISQDRIHFINEELSKEEIIDNFNTRYLNILFRQGFIDTLVERENVAGTDNPSGTAVPHGVPGLVIKTGISIYILKHPVIWKDHVVKYVLFVHVAQQDIHQAKDILGQVYRIIKDKESVGYYLDKKDSNEIVKLLKGVTYDK